MQTSRRGFLSLGTAVPLIALAAAAQRHARLRFPDPASSEPGPEGKTEGKANGLPRPDPRVLQANQEELKKRVEELYKLAAELKNETEKTDSTSILSLPVLKTAREIQKLAKHIQSLARG